MSLCVPGEREAVGPGEEIPQLDGREELPQVLLGHERGKRTTEHTRKTLSAPGLTTEGSLDD